MRIFGWAADREGCGHYRMNLPLDALQDQGLADTYVSEVWNLSDSRATNADVIVGQRVCKPGPSSRWREWCSRLLTDRPLMVYEIDDHLLNVPADNELASAWYNRLDVRQEILLNIRSADMLTVSTPALATEFARYTDRPIFVLPNRIPAYLLDFPHPTHPRSDEKIVFGWAGSMTHGGDFDSIGRMIARFGKRNADRVRLHMMGHNYLPASFGDVRFTPWTSGVRNYYHTLNFDVGLAPLVPNTFNMCKSAIKVLEYAAIGIPSIASDVGPYPSFVENGINGLLIRTDHEWERSMSRLLNEPDTRLHMGENARRDARRHTIEEHARAWLDAYEWGARNAV